MPRFSQDGGGSSGGITPLSTVFYVDGGTNVLVRTGAIDAPFASLQEAWDTLGFEGIPFGSITFEVTPNASVGPLVIGAGSNGFLSIVGMNSSNRLTGAFSAIGAVTATAADFVGLGLMNLTTAAGVTLGTGSALEATNCEIDGNISADTVYATNSILSGNITAAALAHFQLCQFHGGRTITAPEIDVDATSNYYVITQGLTLVGAKVVIADLTP